MTCPGCGPTGMRDHAGTEACLYTSKYARHGPGTRLLAQLLAVLVGASRRTNRPEVYWVVPNMNVCLQCCGSSGVRACCCSVLSPSKPNNDQIKKEGVVSYKPNLNQVVSYNPQSQTSCELQAKSPAACSSPLYVAHHQLFGIVCSSPAENAIFMYPG